MKSRAVINPALHHSVADWDYTTGCIFTLDTSLYISPPSSLRLYYAAGCIEQNYFLCRVAETLCVPQGEVRTWWRSTSAPNARGPLFRNQAALGTANGLNTYHIQIVTSATYLFRYVSGVAKLIGSWAWTLQNNVWYHVRVVFWNGFNLSGEACLCVDFYVEDSGVWVKKGNTVYDKDNYFKDSAINRAGIHARIYGSMSQNFDNTEIWGAV